jgi:hypothetical protein
VLDDGFNCSEGSGLVLSLDGMTRVLVGGWGWQATRLSMEC